MSAAAERNRESALWGWLKNHLKELKPSRHDVQRIENGVAKGTPDVEGCIAGKTFWCELKVAHAMANDKWRIKITSEQVRFALRRSRAGGASWVLVRCCGYTWRENRHFLIRGEDAEQLLQPLETSRLEELSACKSNAAAVEILRTMVGYK